ncbi:MAG: PAS domain S-box protein [Fibrobacteria bacterium]|nr:PAS domain S-box protein [Fibrobacteria bacterium]
MALPEYKSTLSTFYKGHFALIILWSTLILLSLFLNISHERSSIHKLAEQIAIAQYNKEQGYNVRDVRGGVSAAIPISPYLKLEEKHFLIIYLTHGIIFLIGIAGIGFSILRSKNRLQERMAYENELVLSKQFSDSLIDTANAIIVVLDTDGTIITFNKFAEELTGYQKEEVINKNWFDIFIPPQDKPSIQNIHKAVMTGIHATEVHENSIIAKDGATKILRWNNKHIINIKTEKINTISIGINVTGIRKAEAKSEVQHQ